MCNMTEYSLVKYKLFREDLLFYFIITYRREMLLVSVTLYIHR